MFQVTTQRTGSSIKIKLLIFVVYLFTCEKGEVCTNDPSHCVFSSRFQPIVMLSLKVLVTTIDALGHF